MARAIINGNSSPVAVVADVASKRLVITSLFLVVTTAVTVTFEDTDGADISGAMALGANGSLVLPHNPDGWFETPVGKGLKIALGTGVQISGYMNYHFRD